MRTATTVPMFFALLLVGISLAPLAAAQDKLEMYVTPATPLAEKVQDLFNITMIIALFVFVFVEGLLIYMLVKFRKNTKVPKEEPHRGNTTAEVIWTIIPAVILLFLGFLSAGTLVELDTVPENEEADVIVLVEHSRFSFRFIYLLPNGTPDPDVRATVGQLYVEEGSTVKLLIESKDVIHAFAIPQFAVKIDAYPGRTNYQWFETPMGENEYWIQCMEYCGVGHHDMRATLVVFAEGENDKPYGRPGANTTTPPPAANETAQG